MWTLAFVILVAVLSLAIVVQSVHDFLEGETTSADSGFKDKLLLMISVKIYNARRQILDNPGLSNVRTRHEGIF